MKETNEERANRIYGNWNYEDNIENEDVDWLIERAKLSVKYEEALTKIAEDRSVAFWELSTKIAKESLGS